MLPMPMTNSLIYHNYSSENKPPPLFDPQVLAQVLLVCLTVKLTPGDQQEHCYS